jgi:hypothetical protein
LYDFCVETENIDGARFEGVGFARASMASCLASVCARNRLYAENDKGRFSPLILFDIEGATIMDGSLEDVEVIPVDVDASDSIELVRMRSESTVTAESHTELCGLCDDKSNCDKSTPSVVASRAKASSTAVSQVPSNCNTSLSYSLSLNSCGKCPPGCCMSANERFIGIDDMVIR